MAQAPTNVTDQALIEAVGLCKAYAGLNVVDDLSLSLGTAEIMGVIGPNGAGKSTLFGLLAGSVRADQGSIRLQQVQVEHESAQQRIGRGLARSFQIPRPFSMMTVLENVMCAAQQQRGESVIANLLTPGSVARQEKATSARAHELLDFLSLSHLATRPARILSGGQRKLLEFARVLMAGPRLILLDEPAAGVNPALLDFMCERIIEINRSGVAFMIIEHNMQLVRELCPRLLVMAQGRKLIEGAPDDILKDRQVVEAFLGGTVT